MGTAHKIVAVILRMLELGSCGIVLGLLAKFFYALDLINGPTDSRLAYAISMASIGVVASLILIPPVKYSFYAFPLDLALFVCWIVCFALLVDVRIPLSPIAVGLC